MRSITLAAAFASALAVSTLAQQSSPQQQHQQPFSLPTQDERITFASTSHAPSFVGQKVVRLSTATQDQHRALLEHAHVLGVDVWAAHIGAACGEDAGYGCIDMRLVTDTHNEDPLIAATSSSGDEILQSLAQLMGGGAELKAEVLIKDVESVVASQREGRVEQSMRGQEWHTQYHTYDEITAYMHMLEQAYPSHASVVELGRTHENRPILALKISNGLPTPQPPSHPNPQPEPEPEPPMNATSSSGKLGIVITGGSHAREWISTSTSLYFASDLLRAAFGSPHPPSPPSPPAASFKRGKKGRKGRKTPPQSWTKPQARSILSTFTITVIPVVNPDGYVYSWTKNRMWRKNRQPNRFPSGLFCKGVDLNRNFGFAFSSSTTSYNPCSEMYAGVSAFSSAEARALGTYLQDPLNNIRGFFDLHSYGQLLMYPFSYSCDEAVADEEDLLEVSLGAISALKRSHGRQFNTGKICQVYAKGGGNAVDWAYASTELVPGEDGEPREGVKGKIKWSFSIELRDGGTYGFLLPPNQIVPASQEVTAAMAYMLNFIAKKDAH